MLERAGHVCLSALEQDQTAHRGIQDLTSKNINHIEIRGSNCAVLRDETEVFLLLVLLVLKSVGKLEIPL